MAAWPTLPQLRQVLRLQPDANEDAVLQSALAAAIDYGNRRTNYQWPPPVADGSLPDTAYEACLIHAARLYRRRDSLDGTVAWGDAGAIRVGRVDPDVENMYGTVGPVVFS